LKAAPLLALIGALLMPATAGAAGGEITLTGAGSSFDNPLFSKAFSEYTKQHPDIRVNYQSVGSGAGIKQLTEKTVDFGATDAPMTDEQLAAVGGPEAVLHIPVTLGAVAVIYHLPSRDKPLNLDSETLAGIFLGTITKWNDGKIAALNPGVELPGDDITVVHRADGSGTTNIFATYLSSTNGEWKYQVGAGNSLDWPVGLGSKGNEGVAGQVQQIEGAIGYVELAYALQNTLTYAGIKNSAGAFVAPSAEGATACAAAAAATMPADFRLMIAGCTGDDHNVYPISGYSWVVLYANQSDPARGKALVELLSWLIHDGQQYGADLDYAPLPSAVVEQATAALQTVTATANGQPQPLLTAPPAATPGS
jgi:phosphate transport system substrate-binding protein